jgi:hypothetical protein
MKRGRRVSFHGAFATKAAAMRKERAVGGFIQPRVIRGHRRYVVMTGLKRNGPIWEGIKRGARVAYHGYRRKRLEGKLARVRQAEEAAYRNPRRAGIPGHVLEVRYARSGRDPGRYVHRFGPNVRVKLGPGRSRLQLYHAQGQPIWADERGKDFDKWVDLDHHRRRDGNPRGRRTTMARRQHRRKHSRQSSGGLFGLSTTQLLLLGVGGYLWYSGALTGLFGFPASTGVVPIGSTTTPVNATAGP